MADDGLEEKKCGTGVGWARVARGALSVDKKVEGELGEGRERSQAGTLYLLLFTLVCPPRNAGIS